jgi:hypothetical protein
MRVFITQLNEPPAVPAQVATGLAAMAGGQTGAALLPAAVNIVTAGSAGQGRKLNAGIARQEVFARFGFDLLVYPTEGTAIEGYGANVPVIVPAGTNATFTFDGVSLWLAS